MTPVLSPEVRRRLEKAIEASITPFPRFPDEDAELSELQVRLSEYESDAAQDAFTALEEGRITRAQLRRPDLRARILRLLAERPLQAELLETYMRIFDEADDVVRLLEELYGLSGAPREHP